MREKLSGHASIGKKRTDGSVKAKPGAAHELHDLFEDELKEIYWSEKSLAKAIPKMIKNCHDTGLIQALNDHLEETHDQIKRLEKVFKYINLKPQVKKCEAIIGLLKESEESMAGAEKGTVRDVAIIAAVQKIEHYEVASYGTLCAFARTLGNNDALDLLEETLNEEKQVDHVLTGIAENTVNLEAAVEG